MSSPSDPFLVAAFFDQSQLLAVRFTHPGAGGGRVARFAMTRQPDNRGFNYVGIGTTVIIGLVAAGVITTAVHGCRSESPGQPVISDPMTRNCRNNAGWSASLNDLAAALAPRRDDLQPYVVRTLLDIPREQARKGDPTGGWLQPRRSAADEVAHRRGRALAKMLMAAGTGPEVAVILDLPGSQAIAAAAGMAIHFDPVICIDNLPHPAGVVPAAQTLAAAVYWQPEFAESRAGRDTTPPAMFVLDGDRLAPYHNEADRFDNRSYARLPDTHGFETLGVKRILYVRQRTAQTEADDLNELFTVCQDFGIEVRHLALDTLDDVPPAEQPPVEATTHTTTTTHGAPWWFWQRYGWGRPQDVILPAVRDPDADYRTSLRPNRWSTRTVPLDGGERQHNDIITRLTTRPDPESSGGSWGRSHTSSWGG